MLKKTCHCIFNFIRNLVILLPLLLLTVPAFANAKQESVVQIKHEILTMARSFDGQGDPDYSKQKALELLVARLLAAAPQPPIKDRLNDLYGTWKQVWGPYDYRNQDSRGVDPELGITEIYQSVFPGGYYYNVSPIYPDANHNQVEIGLLRGEYELDDEHPSRLNIHFTSYRGINGRPADDLPIWKLAPLAEADELDHEITIVPWIIVQLFFGTGSLDEVYTDQDLRITYASSGGDESHQAIYVMTKVK